MINISDVRECVSGLTQIALMSDSWPVKVCRHIPSLMSQSLAEASQAPDTNSLVSGARERLMTSPVWPANVVVCWPVSMSHKALQESRNTNVKLQVQNAAQHLEHFEICVIAVMQVAVWSVSSLRGLSPWGLRLTWLATVAHWEW